MDKKLRKELEALAKKHGYELIDGCTYCGEDHFAGDNRIDFMMTFSRPMTKEEKE